MTVHDDDARIASAEVRHLALPTGVKPFVLPNGQRTPTDLAALLVRVVDEDGVSGHSLLWAQHERQLALFEAGLRYVAPVVEGVRPGEADAITEAMARATAFVGTPGVCAFAVSGFEMALQDLRCRRRDTSLSRLLGRRRDNIRAYQTGLMLQSTVEELVAEAQATYRRGIKAMKMLVGRPALEEDVERLQAVRAALPADATLMVDALQRWDAGDALRAAEAFVGFGLVWIEDPIPPGDIAGYRELVRHSPVPVATGETCFSTAEFMALLDVGVPYVVGELERVGGVRGWTALAGLATERGAVMLSHLYPHVSAQLLAASPQDEVWWEYVPWFDELVGDAFEVHDGLLTVDDRPGSGFHPLSDAVDRLSRSPWLRLTA